MLQKALAIFIGLFSASAMPQEFQAGQVWKYNTRPGEEASKIYIVKVEAWPNGDKIFHIYADKLKIKNPMLASGLQAELPHAPVSLQTLEQSTTKQVGTTQTLPDISEGYAAWKEAYDAGGAGIFTIPVAEIISLIEGVVSQPQNIEPS